MAVKKVFRKSVSLLQSCWKTRYNKKEENNPSTDDTTEFASEKEIKV